MNLVDLFAEEIHIPSVLNPQTIQKFQEQLDAIKSKRTRFIILRGSNDIFCNGLDFKWISQIDSTFFPDQITSFYKIMDYLHTCPYITIAAVEGEVAGGGIGIASACDFIVASRNSKFSLPEGTLGLIPGVIMPFLLNKLSAKEIKKMVFTGRKFDSLQMQNIDFVDEVVDANAVHSKLIELIKSMSSCKQQSIAEMKQVLKNHGVACDQLYQKGLENLASKLNSEEFVNRFAAIAEYFSD